MSVIISAINGNQYIEFHYEGHYRKVIPYAYGRHVTTHNKVMRGLQVAGTSTSGKFDFPKLFIADEMSRVNVLVETFEIPVGYKKGDDHINPIDAEL